MKSEDSPLVIQSVLKFGVKLLGYFSLEDVVSFLIRVLEAPGDHEQDDDVRASHSTLWTNCHQMAIDLLFTDLFSYSEEATHVSLLFGAFLTTLAKLFTSRSVQALTHLKKTTFYVQLPQNEAKTSSASPRKFYSSITVTRLSNGAKCQEPEEIDSDEALNELFEHFMQISSRFLITRPQLKCNLVLSRAKLSLDDLIAFELCTRVSAQSLFSESAAELLGLATSLVSKMFSTQGGLKLKLKSKDDSEASAEHRKTNCATSYLSMVRKHCVRTPAIILAIYQQLFKAISVQASNSANEKIRVELEPVLDRLYVHLCSLFNTSPCFAAVMDKFLHSPFFQALATPNTASPSKANASVSLPFLQFIFKFLLQDERSKETAIGDEELALISQIRTINIFDSFIQELVSSVKPLDASLLNALVYALLFCLGNSNEQVRSTALQVLGKVQGQFQFVAKICKHGQEICVDGVDYLRRKSLSKAMDERALSEVQSLLSIRPKIDRLNFFANFSNEELGARVLSKFKRALLFSFALAKDEIKTRLMDSVMSVLIWALNEPGHELHIQLIVQHYIITSQSAKFFSLHEKHFDYLMAYLRKSCSSQDQEGQAPSHLSHFGADLISRVNSQFFVDLPLKMQLDLLKSVFDASLSGNCERARDSLSRLGLLSTHFAALFDERAGVVVEESGNAVAETTKQMKKQLKQMSLANVARVNWRELRLVLELLQAELSAAENQMETDEESIALKDSFISLSSLLFQVLELTQAVLALKSNCAEISSDESQRRFLLNQDGLLQYLQIISLGSLLSIYRLNKEANKAALSQSPFNVELLMQLLQAKQCSDDLIEANTFKVHGETNERLDVQEHVLLLLSEASSVHPDKVLEHVLIMFVFVGDKLARKDDSYSFQIIGKVVQSILPSIINSSSNVSGEGRLQKAPHVMQRHQKQLPYVSALVCKILQSFVVALPHIPAHRKTPVFGQLLRIVGLNDYLWITVIQAIDHYLVQSQDLLDFTNSLAQITSQRHQEPAEDRNQRRLRDSLKSCAQAMIALHSQFEPGQVVQSCVYLVVFLTKYLTKLFDTGLKLSLSKDADLNLPANKVQNKQVYSHLACELDNYNLLQMKYLAYNLLQFVTDLLASEQMLSKLAELYEGRGSDQLNTEYSALFQNLLEKILLLVLRLGQAFAAFDKETQGANGQRAALADNLRRFNKAIVNKSYELMERTLSLLDSRQFVLTVRSLIKHESSNVRRRVLTLLTNRLRKHEPSPQEASLLISLVDDLLDALEAVDDDEAEVNNQTVLFAIKLVCKRIGESNPLAFSKVIKALCDKFVHRKIFVHEEKEKELGLVNVNLLSSLLLCLGELCLKLKSQALKYLNQVMTFTLEMVEQVKRASNKPLGKNYELLVLSSVTCLLKIVQNLSNFLSPFLPRLIFLSCSLSELLRGDEDQASARSAEARLNQLRSSLAALIPLRLLAPVLIEQSNLAGDEHALRMNPTNLEFYMQMIKVAVKSASQEDLLVNIRTLRTMFMNLFELRSAAKRQRDLCRLEDFVIDAFCELTFKLSEDLFRPIFFRLFEWATLNDPPKDRLITFYRLAFR